MASRKPPTIILITADFFFKLYSTTVKTHQVYNIIYNKDKNTKQLQTKHILLSTSAVGKNFTHLYKIVTAAGFELLESNSLSDMNR